MEAEKYCCVDGWYEEYDWMSLRSCHLKISSLTRTNSDLAASHGSHYATKDIEGDFYRTLRLLLVTFDANST